MTVYDFYLLGTSKHFAREDMTFEEALAYADKYNLWYEEVKNPGGIV